MKSFFGKKSRSALTGVLVLSLGLHLVALLIFGTVKFVTDALREETVFEAAPVVPPPQKEPEYQVNLQQRNQDTPPPRPPAIVVNNPSELDIPALDIDVNVDSSAVYGRGGGGFGDGIGGLRDMTISAELFGLSISSNNLGVVLDISGSAHPHLDSAIREIDKNFPDAHMVLVVGCGMSDGTKKPQGNDQVVPGTPRIHPYRDIDIEKENNKLRRSAYQSIRTFLNRIKKDVSGSRAQIVERYLDKRRNLYVLYGGDVWAANFAFEFLLEKEVDTIYWFADFKDGIDPKIAEPLTRELRKRRIKVIAHNFMGKPVSPAATEIARSTRGDTIEVVPGK